MARLHQCLFSASLVALCWLGMMAMHELGHVAGAWLTGGTVQRVVVHPLAISRTDVSPNPHPAVVVWLGPLVGVFAPLVIVALISRRLTRLRDVAVFFAGFCLIANGAYIAAGSFRGIGDCGEMLRTGTPRGVMWLFGSAALAGGLYLWHRLGTLGDFIAHPEQVSPRAAWLMVLVLAAAIAIAMALHA